MESKAIVPEFVEFIPSELDDGRLYISERFQTASHTCACGCGSKVVTPLKSFGWKLINNKGAVSLSPSIGNWSQPCQSHYWIRNNRIEWAPKWSGEQIEYGRQRDSVDRNEYFEKRDQEKPLSIWERIKRFFRFR